MWFYGCQEGSKLEGGWTHLGTHLSSLPCCLGGASTFLRASWFSLQFFYMGGDLVLIIVVSCQVVLCWVVEAEPGPHLLREGHKVVEVIDAQVEPHPASSTYHVIMVLPNKNIIT